MTETAYDIIDYPSCARPQTHPSRLAVIARLHGLDTAWPTRCRVLEVGCGDGGNLFPLALTYPDSEFIGVDLSEHAIARGERLRSRLGLTNLQLRVADLTAWDAGTQPFDYIIAHGFYSWVPTHVREALLNLCRDKLTPHGLAYISYNALPGCHLRRMVWEMLRFHVRDVVEPQARIREALAFLKFLSEGVVSKQAYAQVVREEARQLREETNPAVLFHDDLAELNEPLTVVDFIAQARAHGLEFVAEADYFESTEFAASPDAVEHLREQATQDVALKEQYLDFLKGRRFRQTLLCRSEAPLQREPDNAVIAQCDVIGQITVDTGHAVTASREANGEVTVETTAAELVDDLEDDSVLQFSDPHGGAVSTNQPVAKAALTRVGEVFPAPLAFDELLAYARAQVDRDEASYNEDREALLQTLLVAFKLGLVTLHAGAPRFSVQAGRKPQISDLVRAQLESGTELVTSLRPSAVRLENPLTRELVSLLDGTRDRDAILRDLVTRMAANPALQPPDEPAHPLEWWREKLAPQLEAGLEQAARMALLIA